MSAALGVGLWTILFWLLLGVALGGLLARLLGTTVSSAASALGVGDFVGKSVTVKGETSRPADQLEAIEGVGPQIAELFRKNGVHSFGQIAAMAPADISRMLAAGGSAFAIAQPYTWPFQARLLENGWIAEFLEVGQWLKAGRLPVTGLNGVGPATAERLVAAEAGTVEALAKAEPAALASRMAAAGEGMAEGKLGGFITEARKVLTGDMATLAAFFGLPAAVLAPRTAETIRETREVTGPIVGAQGLASVLPAATATATGGSSMLPVWLGLGGAGLLALLCLLGLWCPMGRVTEVDVRETVIAPAPEAAVTTPVVPTGQGLISELRNGRPMLIVYFETAKSDVSNELTAESAKLDAHLDQNPDARLSVSGYVDPRGDAAFNEKLARDRATKVRDALVAAGIPETRIDLDKPADIVGDEASMAAERKVEVTVKDGAPAAP